jgi:hypothetical protein
MSLSLTPLTEAWSIPKVKKKKEQNIYTTNDAQKKILNDANLELNTSLPTGNNINEMKYFATSNEKIPQSIEKENSEKENIKKKSITVEITDNSVVQLLEPYNMSYIKTIINKSIKQYLNKDVEEYVEKFETYKPFQINKSSNMYIYILLAIIVLDIVMRI